MFIFKSLGLLILAASAVCVPAQADDRAVNTIAGAALGAAIGNHNGGRDGAIVGGVIGAAIGNSVSTRDQRYSTTYYEAPRRVTYVETHYVEPAPVYYYQPAPRYYAPQVVYVESRSRHRGHSRHHGHGHRHGHGHGHR